MTIPTENLDAMIQFLTEQSETNGDHFMLAVAMLQTQQARITDLERQVSARQLPKGMTITRVKLDYSNSIMVKQGSKSVCVDPCDVSDTRELLYSLARVFLPPKVEPEDNEDEGDDQC